MKLIERERILLEFAVQIHAFVQNGWAMVDVATHVVAELPVVFGEDDVGVPQRVHLAGDRDARVGIGQSERKKLLVLVLNAIHFIGGIEALLDAIPLDRGHVPALKLSIEF